MNKNVHFIVITGPTAVGKSSLAIDLALEYNFPIISADSRQVFKELNIGTAKPSIEERKGVPHIWMDKKSITQKISAGVFVRDVQAYLKKEKPSCVILCGGTQFYIDSMLYGIDETPPISDAIKTQVQKKVQSKGLAYLQNEVKKRDPAYFKEVDIYNPRRLQRALEVSMETGKPFSSFLNKDGRKIPAYSKIAFFLNRNRTDLYNRINRRVDHMIKAGLEEEAYGLYPQKNNRNLQTVGYQEFFNYFDGEVSKDEAIQLIKRNTRRYAKRQITWLRSSRFRYMQRLTVHENHLRKEVQLFLLKHSI